MLQSLREETEGTLQMLLSPRKNGLASLFKGVRVFKVLARNPERVSKESPGAFRPQGPKSVRNSLETVSRVSK